MFRLLLSAIVMLLFASQLPAQCRSYWPPIYVPIYQSPHQFWGTPAPKPLPPAPLVPKPGVGVREEESKPPKPMDKSKPKEGEPKDKDAPKIPKLDLPLPDDPDEPATKKDVPKKKEPRADVGMTVEQYLISADASKSERPAEVKVGFFNHSERDLVLEVNGDTVKLPSEQYVTLRLKRTFTWAKKGQKGTEVAVPPDADGIEIVFRK